LPIRFGRGGRCRRCRRAGGGGSGVGGFGVAVAFGGGHEPRGGSGQVEVLWFGAHLAQLAVDVLAFVAEALDRDPVVVDPLAGEGVGFCFEVLLHFRDQAEGGDGGVGVEQGVVDAVGLSVVGGEVFGVGAGHIGAEGAGGTPVGVLDDDVVGGGD